MKPKDRFRYLLKTVGMFSCWEKLHRILIHFLRWEDKFLLNRRCSDVLINILKLLYNILVSYIQKIMDHLYIDRKGVRRLILWVKLIGTGQGAQWLPLQVNSSSQKLDLKVKEIRTVWWEALCQKCRRSKKRLMWIERFCYVFAVRKEEGVELMKTRESVALVEKIGKETDQTRPLKLGER